MHSTVEVSKFLPVPKLDLENNKNNSSEKKKEKTLFGLINTKIGKIQKILEEQEDIDITYLSKDEKEMLALQLNRTVQKVMWLQTKFLE